MVRTSGFEGLQRAAFVLVGVALFLGSLMWMISIRDFTRTASRATGVVTAMPNGGSHPEVRFTAQNGGVVNTSQNGLIRGYSVGDRVRVLYDPRRPRDARLDDFGGLWGFPICSTLMGVVFILGGIFGRSEPESRAKTATP